VGVQVRWDRGSTEPAGEYALFCGKRNENHELDTAFFVHKRISDRMSCWYHIIVQNVHAKREDKTYDGRTASMRNWNVCLIHSLNTI
jgi:hypothetical protein